MTLPKQQVQALLSRLKIMANLNIAERRLPQDGQSRIKIGEDLVDIRVSVIPILCGERVVLRLLDKGRGELGLIQIGFSSEALGQFRNLIRVPHGIILLTGPTGSGKTTTLYAAVSELNCEERNILTVEDPIEYQLPGIGQMQVRPKINLTFANCLRHILRQDPDVIMVG
jgi:type II secretory ATPase GspE/PulE/Tfp pilus assembly ATPase PilB-like protein